MSTTAEMATGSWEFYDAHVAFPGANEKTEYQVSLSAPGGGTFGEFSIEFVDLGSGVGHARIQAFGDSWKAIAHGRLIDGLSLIGDGPTDPDAIRDALLAMGMVDITEQLADRSHLAICPECNGRGVVRRTP